MKAAMFYGGKDIRVEEIPDPVAGPGQVVFDIKAAGICGSDMHGYRHARQGWLPVPHTNGHELMGVVTQVGEGVTKVKVGDRIGVEPLHLVGCGKCPYCRTGSYESCIIRGRAPDGSRMHSGGFAEKDWAPESNVYKLPDSITNEQAAILDVYACAVHTIHRVPAGPMHNVVVVGAGPIGLSIVEAYKAIGARKVFVVDVSQTALDIAKKDFGADEAINSAKVDLVQAVKDLTDGMGANVVIEAVGGMAPTFKPDIEMLANMGTLGIIGMYQEPQALDTQLAMAKQIQIVYINSYGAWNGVTEFQITIDMILNGDFHPERQITHKFPLAQVVEGFETMDQKAKTGAIKVLIIP